MTHVNRITESESNRKTRRALYYIEQPEVSTQLDPAAQIAQLVCRVYRKWDADQSPNKEEFLRDLRIMIGLDPDHADYRIFSRELRLSDAQRAALIVAVSTVLNIDQRDVPGEHSPSEHHLREIITSRYGSNDDSVQRFQTDLMQEMEKQAQRQ